jgi:hypothetical protein
MLLLLGVWYNYKYSMDVAEDIEYNSAEFSQKLLIATQGSEFKNALINEVIATYQKEAMYIKVIDVEALEQINLKEYNAILLVHTWENWKAPVVVERFVNNLSKAKKNQLVVVTTSGRGSYKMDGVDAITGESNIKNIIPIANQIIERLDILLKSKPL